ncbi:hypothetical protein Tco_1553614 [Tanacetum coccineum]
MSTDGANCEHLKAEESIEGIKRIGEVTGCGLPNRSPECYHVRPSQFPEATYASNDPQHLAVVLRLFCDFILVLEPLQSIDGTARRRGRQQTDATFDLPEAYISSKMLDDACKGVQKEIADTSETRAAVNGSTHVTSQANVAQTWEKVLILLRDEVLSYSWCSLSILCHIDDN